MSRCGSGRTGPDFAPPLVGPRHCPSIPHRQPHGFGFGAGRQGAMHHQATVRRVLAHDQVDLPEQDVACHFARGRLGERLLVERPVVLTVTLHGLHEQALLVAERKVEAGHGHAHGLRHGGDGRSLVAVGPEQAKRGVQRFVLVKSAGPSARHL